MSCLAFDLLLVACPPCCFCSAGRGSWASTPAGPTGVLPLEEAMFFGLTCGPVTDGQLLLERGQARTVSRPGSAVSPLTASTSSYAGPCTSLFSPGRSWR